MVKRWLSLAIVIGAALVVAGAAAAVTFITTSGDRHVGDIAMSSAPSASMPEGELALERGAVRLSFGTEQVAMIDFAGVTPPAAELRTLADDGHHVVLRNGRPLQGRLVSLRPDVLRFHNNAVGRTEEYRVTDVSRIYLNTERVRSIFNLQDASSDPSFPPTSWGNRRTGEVTVAGSIGWIDTGLDVTAGDRITFQSTGQVRLSGDRTSVTGPAGIGEARSPNYPVPAVAAGALIARIDDGAPFFIGGGRQVATMPQSGRLRLGVNDDNVNDNAGAFRVRMTR